MKTKNILQINPYIFRKYDIRGNVEQDFGDDVVLSLGKAFGTRVIRSGNKKVGISGDIRLTTHRLKQKFTEGLLSTGCDVVDIGITSTPVNYYASYAMDIEAAVQITGSHNPSEFNGFKLTLNKRAFFNKKIAGLKTLISQSDYEIGNGKRYEYDLLPQYRSMLLDKIKLERTIRVVADYGNAVGALFFDEILRSVGCEVVSLFNEPDGTFPNHHPDPTVDANLNDLIQTVRSGDFDLGIAFDGDADRVGVVDENGTIIRADYLMAILSEEVLNNYPNAPVIFDVKCSKVLPESIEKFGGKPLIWKTGHSLIKEKMREVNSPFSGELSGHIFYADEFYGFDDALYVALRLIRMLSRTENKLSNILAKFPTFPSSPEIRGECVSDEDKFRIADKCIAFFKTNYKCSEVDGVRIEFPEGWGLIRASNTQPAIVCRFEANSETALSEIRDLVFGKIHSFGEVKF